MDPISLSALVPLIAKSAAGEAGKSVWEGLSALTRRVFGHGAQAETALAGAQSGNQDAALDLAGRLVQSAATDPELETLLRAWIEQAKQAQQSGNTYNTISGHVHGGIVIQARDVSGGVHQAPERGDTPSQ